MTIPKLWRLALVLAAIPLLSSPVPFTAPDGDLNLDGLANVADIQCQVLVHERLTAAGMPGQDLCATDEACFEFGLDCCMDVCEHCSYCAGGMCIWEPQSV